MADEPKRSPRSSSTGATRKGRTPPASAASGAEAAAGKPETASAETSGGPKTAAPASEPARPVHAAPPARAEASGSGNGVALAGLIAGAVGIVLALTYPQWTPIVYGSSAAEERLTEMRGEIEALKSTIVSMTEQQATLEASIRTAKLPGILMVAEDLRTALGESEPYAGTLNLFRSLSGDDPAVAPIIAAVEGRADVGVPSVEGLQAAFDEVAHTILMAEQRPAANGNLASQVSDTVANLAAATMRLRWRLDGAPTGDSVPAVVARAEQAVLNGDWQLAIDTLGVLPAERASLAQSWVEMVRARMQAEAVREELDAYVISTAARIR